jgi:hypothetical protein
MATYIEKSDGCLDLRDLTSVRLCVDIGEDDESDGAAARKEALCFEVKLASGGVVKLEAFTRGDAIEWMTGLNNLMAYWRIRHRVE